MTAFLNRLAFFKIFLGLIFVAISPFSFVAQLEKSVVKTVCIDPGHGGKDPGCHGQTAQEKKVCLAIGLELGRLIKLNYPDVKVVFTRKTDVFIELDDRATIANKAKADLFICIHANAGEAKVSGAETYVLGLHKSEAQMKIADRENSAVYLESDKGEKYKDFDMSPDAIIARNLQLSVFLDHSISYATKVQQEFKIIGRSDRGVKQAGFIVLYKTTMPSVLVETGFLSNPTEEKFLADSTNQKLMANSMFVAFQQYKAQMEGKPIPVRVSEPKTIDPKVVDPKTTDVKIEEVQEENKPLNTALNSTETVTVENIGKIIFRVQIVTSEVKLAPRSTRLKGIKCFEYQQDNLFKYTSGEFLEAYTEANNYKNELRKEQFPNAFVVAFLDGERINLEKAIKLAKK
jgi:N-acetylmuramoyl-L-alanine amidase